MKNLQYKIIPIVSILVLLLTGCGVSGDGTGQGTTGTKGSWEDTVSWKTDFTQLDNQYVLALTTDSSIYGCYIRDDEVCLDSINKESLSLNQTFVLSDASEIWGMAADRDGNLYILGKGESAVGIWKITGDGALQAFANMELEDRADADNLYLKDVCRDSKGYFYIWCEMQVPKLEMVGDVEREVWHTVDRVYIKDGQWNTLRYEEISNVSGTKVLNFQISTDGTPLFIAKDQEGAYTQEIDISKQEQKDKVRLTKVAETFDADYINSLENIVSTDDGFLYCQNNELYEFNYKTQEIEKILNLSSHGIYSSDILSLGKNEDGYEIIDNYGALGCTEFITIILGENAKETVTLGMTMTFQDLEKAVSEFNRYHREYRVEIIDYSGQLGDYSEACEQLKLDVVTGKAPDVIAVSEIDYSMFSEKGVLVDLYDYMQGDAELSKEMLLTSIAKTYEDAGHLYSMAPTFQLHSMWGYGDVTRGRSGVTFEELVRLLESSGKNINAITGFSADEPVLTRLCTVAMDEFVDWENGACNFNGDYFKKILAFAKEYTGNYTGGTYAERIQSREVVMSVGIICGVTDYQLQKELYGGDITMIGYPVVEGTGTVAAFRGSAVAINAQSDNSAGAWEFVKFYLLHGYDGYGFPVIKEQFEQVMKSAMEEEYIVAENGEKQRLPKGHYSDGESVDIFVYAATEEDVDAIVHLVEGLENCFESHAMIQNIINEEAEGYFSGQVDLDKTVEKIQKRVMLLLQESL